jgi:hypothetical protein
MVRLACTYKRPRKYIAIFWAGTVSAKQCKLNHRFTRSQESLYSLVNLECDLPAVACWCILKKMIGVLSFIKKEKNYNLRDKKKLKLDNPTQNQRTTETSGGKISHRTEQRLLV